MAVNKSNTKFVLSFTPSANILILFLKYFTMKTSPMNENLKLVKLSIFRSRYFSIILEFPWFVLLGGIVSRATLKMAGRKSKTQFLKQERNTQNVIALLNYFKRIAMQK